MVAIILESALFIAAIAVGAALLTYLVLEFTPLGLRVRQDRNRRVIERAAELRCPVHGAQREEQLVRLPSGERICPECFKEVVDGHDAE